jgi:hypothetical protein
MAISQSEKIQFLAQGGYDRLVHEAIAANASPDAFAVDLLTEVNREPVLIASGQVLPAGSILVRTYTPSVTAASGNTGNGTLTVVSVGPYVLEGAYTATCVSKRTDRGLFEVRNTYHGVIGRANVGTTFTSDDLQLLIADGSADFVLGDTFSIQITGGNFSGYDFDADEAAFVAGTPIVQVASGVLSADIDTLAFGAQEQFATVRGPAVLPAAFVKLGNSPWGLSNYQRLQDAAMDRSIEQLARRGIVLR